VENLGVPRELATDIVRYFVEIANDLRTRNLEKSSVGKFVETLVQIFQSLDPKQSAYDGSVKDVDIQLSRVYESRSIARIPDESRVCMVRIARGINALRCKRSIIHKNEVDPNEYDLEFIYNACQWIMSELVRVSTDVGMSEARSLIADIHRPALPCVERILGRQLVLNGKLGVKEEVLLLLFDSYSDQGAMPRTEIGRAIDRRSSSSVSNALRNLWKERYVEGNTENGYRLTKLGLKRAQEIIIRLENG
jgi:hypothetical protein